MLLIEAPQAHGIAALAAVVAEITVAETARHQVVAVVALATQIAIRMVAHPLPSRRLTLAASCRTLFVWEEPKLSQRIGQDAAICGE